MTEQKDEIRLKELLSVFGKDKQKELIEILHRDQIRYHKEQLLIHGVMHSFIIVGWEYNETWNVVDLYFGEEDEILKTTDCFEKCIKFKTLKEATEKLTYLKENFGDYGWYITII